ncbi:ABC transporter, fused permease protein, partial [hydrothermal vent metagenome]
TAIAIILGVAFVSGTYVFTDTIKGQFDSLFTDIYQGVDVAIAAEGTGVGSADVPFDESILDVVAAVDGVEIATGGVTGFATIITTDDAGDPKIVQNGGAPTLGFAWSDVSRLSPLSIKDGNGRGPTAPGEVAIDVGTATAQGFELGDVVKVQATGEAEDFTIVGLMSFGDQDSLLGATLSAFEMTEAQRIFGLEGQFNSIGVAAISGVSAADLARDINEALPAGIIAITGQSQQAADLSEVNDSLGIINIALLSFAAVAVFVGSFIIQNTFRIIVTQRTRELAMLRAIGATGRQVIVMVVVEALIVALFASALGVVVGIGLAGAIRSAMNAAGLAVPPGSLVVLSRTVFVGMATGVIVTMLAALLPAYRASKVSPVAAMRGETRVRRTTMRKRAITGVSISALGLVFLMTGLFGSVGNAIANVGGGALIMFIGVSVLAPLAARPIANVIGAPLPKIFGITGTLAKENTKRAPRRTASTASALMIGIALVTFVAIFAATIKASVAETVDEAFPSDFTIQSSQLGEDPNIPMTFSRDLVGQVDALDEVAVAGAFQFGEALIDGEKGFITAVDPAKAESLLTIEPAPGALDSLTANTIIVSEKLLKARNWTVGESVTITTPLVEDVPFTVTGTFGRTEFGDYLISTEVFTQQYEPTGDGFVAVKLAPGVSLEEGRAAILEVTDNYPTTELQDKSELVADAEKQIDGALALFQGLLGLAIFIAVIGIVNTLALSIIERTREIGLVRAVGMSRRKVRKMIRWESVIVSLFGATLGIGMGLFFGWAVARALEDEGLGKFAVPFGQLMAYVVIAFFAGLIAAVWPAFKAARLNVLEAIAYE